MFILHLARRYATSRLVNYIAGVAIALCVLVQIVTMAVMDGSLREYQRRIQGLGEQITVFMPYGGGSQRVYEDMAAEIRKIPGVKGVSPGLKRYGVVNNSYMHQPVLIYGIDIDSETTYGSLGEFVIDQSSPSWLPPNKKESDPTRPGILIGANLAESLAIDSEDVLQNHELALEFIKWKEEKLIRRSFSLASRFRSGIDYFDSHIVYIPIAAAQEMFSPSGTKEVSHVAVWLDDPMAATMLKEPVLAAAGRIAEKHGLSQPSGRTSEEAWQRAFRGMAYENALLELVMSLISLSSGFAIFAIMYTLVASRVRDIGILRAVGTSRFKVTGIFLLVGMLIGVAGAVLGGVAGVTLSYHVNEVYEFIFREPLYPPYLFGVEKMPVHVDFIKVALRTGGAALMSIIATLPVAIWAGRLQPLEALRHE